jgi:two-component system sensor histidine kinase RpfC
MAKPVSTERLLDALAGIASNSVVEAVASAPGPRMRIGPDVFDSTVLDELGALGLGNTFEREFIAQCLKDADVSLEALRSAGAQGNWSEVREQAHALKGVAGNLGLVTLADVSGVIMKLPQQQLATEWTARLQGLTDRLTEGKSALDARSKNCNSLGEGEHLS